MSGLISGEGALLKRRVLSVSGLISGEGALLKQRVLNVSGMVCLISGEGDTGPLLQQRVLNVSGLVCSISGEGALLQQRVQNSLPSCQQSCIKLLRLSSGKANFMNLLAFECYM